MEPTSFASILPNLSIAAIAVLALAYLCKFFISQMEKRDTAYAVEFAKRDEAHRIELKEREDAFRALEKEVRTTLSSQLARNTNVMERIINHLDLPH